MKTPMEELIELLSDSINQDNTVLTPKYREAYKDGLRGAINVAQSLLEKERQMVIDVIEWYEDLTPVQKVSAWSKPGETKGLFNMDSIQLADKYYNKKFSK